MKEKKISAIIPIASWDLKRSLLLFSSLNKFFDKDSLHTLFIIFPQKEIMINELEKINFKFDYQVFSEKDIVPSEEYNLFKTRKGWYRQQIMKLYIAKQVKTEFYICLDSDVICIKNTNYSDLIKNGKPSINIEPKSVHERWWKDSLKVLKVQEPKTDKGMTSSTNIFITDEVLHLINHIEKTYNKSFIRTLFNWFWVNKYISMRKWTEYKLYWLFIEHRKKTNAYDYESPVWGESIWKSTEHINDKLFSDILNSNNKGHFAIVQGNRIEDDLAYSMAKKHLDI